MIARQYGFLIAAFFCEFISTQQHYILNQIKMKYLTGMSPCEYALK